VITIEGRVRRLERRVARLRPPPTVPPDAAEVMARIAATQPVTPAEQARHRAELLAALNPKETT
jgi:hypothetical protein